MEFTLGNIFYYLYHKKFLLRFHVCWPVYPLCFYSYLSLMSLFLRRHCLCHFFPFNLQCTEVITCLHLLTSYHFLVIFISTLHFFHFLSAGCMPSQAVGGFMSSLAPSLFPIAALSSPQAPKCSSFQNGLADLLSLCIILYVLLTDLNNISSLITFIAVLTLCWNL